jgi:response regulator RpfG family c-di-GMP phosphodiesterase
MNKNILLVDDDHDIISGYQRNLRKLFKIKVALKPSEGLQILNDNPEFAVVVSDYRMPEMNGVEFLSEVANKYPDTVRIIITGFADLKIAIESVNKGNVFRFLTKPLPTDQLINVLNDSIELYRLVNSEKELLNKTLSGSIKILIDMLSAVQPVAFSQATQIRKLARRVAEKMNLKNFWEIEMSAMLSQIGCVTIPAEVLEKRNNGEELTDEEEKLYRSHPEAGQQFIKNIPRLENIAIGIAYQDINFDGSNTKDEKLIGKDIPVISRILKIVNDYDYKLKQGNSPKSAFKEIIESRNIYDPEIIKVLGWVLSGQQTQHTIKSITFKQLRLGMILAKDIKDTKGNVLLSKGNEVTDVMLMRLIHASKVRQIKEPILIIEVAKE